MQPHTRPRPTAPPVYVPSKKLNIAEASRWRVSDLLDVIFFISATVAVGWLALLMANTGLSLSPWNIARLLVFWLILTYLALPRLHQVLTWLYVPEYFIGRTRTGDGLLGDPVNMAVRGSEEQIHQAMQKAGWTLADPITLRSAWGIVVSSVLRRSYPKAPVSDLFLFGKKQSFAYQMEVEGNPAQRHHVRFWPVPSGWVLPGGHHADFLAAGTYDRSVGFSTFTFQITHKIDADIDIERDFICDSVRFHNEAAQLEIIREFSTAFHHKNGGGDRVQTDGDLHVLDVSEVRANPEELDLPVREIYRASDRPASIIFACLLVAMQSVMTLAFLMAMTTDEVAEIMGIKVEDISSEDLFQLEIAQVIVVLISLVMLCAVLGLTTGTWLGRPRARVLLMFMLTFSIVVNASQIGLGSDTDVTDMLRVGLLILALFIVSSPRAHAFVDEISGRRALRKKPDQPSVIAE